MNWFGGMLLVTDRNGVITVLHDISFHAAAQWLRYQESGVITEAMFHPYPTSMELQ